ncbi:MAG: transposase [Mameliella sp.]|nr:transposase [Phaeodactylibacter sp.]
MGKRKFSIKQRLSILAEHDSGASIADLCRKHQISPATLYKWKKEKTTDENEQLRRLKALEAENKRLKKMYAELSIDHDILKQGYGMLKKWQAQDDKNA